MKKFVVVLVAHSAVNATVDIEAEDAKQAGEKALALANASDHPEVPQRVFWDVDSDGSGIEDCSIEVEEVTDLDDIEEQEGDY